MAFLLERFLPTLISAVCICLLSAFTSAVFLGAVLRYGFDIGSVQLEDFINYAFAALVVLSVLIAFFRNAHVHVKFLSVSHDILQTRLVRFLSATPFIAIAVLSLPAVYFSWSIYEGSTEPGGVGGYFLVKTLLPISFGLIAVFLCFRGKASNR